MSNEIVTTRDTQLEKQRLGKMALSLTEFGTTNEPEIAAGSVVEIGGSLFVVTVDEAITGWAGIGNDTDAYIRLVPGVGGADFAAEFTTTAPTWSASKQGWYHDIKRYVGGLRRGASAAAYENKWIYQRSQDNNASHRFYGDGTVEFDNAIIGDVTGALTGNADTATVADGVAETGAGAEVLLTKVIEIGDWNMNTTDHVCVAHGMGAGFYLRVRSVSAMILIDVGVGSVTFALDSIIADTGAVNGGAEVIDATNVDLYRTAAVNSGRFDGPNYSDIAFNRGRITIQYAE